MIDLLAALFIDKIYREEELSDKLEEVESLLESLKYEISFQKTNTSIPKTLKLEEIKFSGDLSNIEKADILRLSRISAVTRALLPNPFNAKLVYDQVEAYGLLDLSNWQNESTIKEFMESNGYKFSSRFWYDPALIGGIEFFKGSPEEFITWENTYIIDHSLKIEIVDNLKNTPLNMYEGISPSKIFNKYKIPYKQLSKILFENGFNYSFPAEVWYRL